MKPRIYPTEPSITARIAVIDCAPDAIRVMWLVHRRRVEEALTDQWRGRMRLYALERGIAEAGIPIAQMHAALREGYGPRGKS